LAQLEGLNETPKISGVLRQPDRKQGRRQHVAACIGVFGFALLSVFPFVDSPMTLSSLGWELQAILIAIASMILGFALSAVVSLSSGAARRHWLRFLLPIGALSIGLARTLDLRFVRFLSQYGDDGDVVVYLNDGREFARWQLGLTLLQEAHAFVNSFLFDIDTSQFARLTGALLMALWGIWMLKPGSVSVVPWLLTSSPLWILFSLGYDEYYPFVAGLTIAAAWSVFAPTPIFQRDTTYIVVGLLPALYVGALPVSIALLVRQWARESSNRERSRGSIFALATLLIAIELGGELRGYIENLREHMNLGWEDSASARSFFADASYVFSLRHLLDIWFWLACSGAIVAIVGTFAYARWRVRSQARENSTIPLLRRLFEARAQALLVVLAVIFLVFMLPLLGPTRDIDLYFISMFVFLLVLGTRLDSIVKGSADPANIRQEVLHVAAWGSAPVTAALVFFGVGR
jgi:hypothetical protein